MSRIERLREYSKPLRKENWQGASRDLANIDRWSNRAEENSDGADHRGSDGEVKLPDTGKRTDLRDTAMSPRTSRKVDAAMVDAKSDLNHVGGSYLKDIRRNA